IIFPEDFTYNDDNNKVLTSQALREAIVYSAYNEKEMHLSDDAYPLQIRSFGLMDGGITDNQALKSLMLADEKRRRKQKPDPFDLMIVTDVSSYFMDYYKAPDQKGEKGWRGKSIDHYVSLFQKAVRHPLRIQNGALAIAIARF